ncbi:DsbA family oxidoreductase [Cognatilysobacter bugurensis]|uniref:DSBA oxidoreductase n=1 Tax=Cognatilysobacter bugurensis TaxID=543356 RepID=A0A918T2M4_9GAMM|nr:DsbA family oxidoreductase [Lysobacter bugurensis]GHA80427.1 DSBA oxidoreductase [Lysobacter bugurensis]
MSARPEIRIDVWSDFVCPFCLLEEPVLDALKAEYGDRLEIAWRAYELRPDPVPTLDPDGEYLHDIWARAVYPMAADRGMPIKLPPVQPRSRLAHEATHHAREHGLDDAVRRAIFNAFFEDGRDIGQIDTLVDIGAAHGLDAVALRNALERGTHTAAVLADQREAQALGLRGVPALRLQRMDGDGRAMLVSGAQPLDMVRRAIAQL